MQMAGAVQRLDLDRHTATLARAEVQHGDRGVIEPQATEAGSRQTQQAEQQAAQDGVVAHHQHVLVAGCRRIVGRQ